MVTDFEKIKEQALGQEVDLPGWQADEVWRVRLKRPSLISLAAAGKIPNPLLGAASTLFTKGVAPASDTGTKFKDMASVMKIEAKAALAEPTYQQLKDAGIELTDSQLLYIHNFIITGVDVLSRFRTVGKPNKSNGGGTGKKDNSQ